jgi:hypothetical protein
MRLTEYLEQRSIPVSETGCWLWLISIGHGGYGKAKFDGKTHSAHRLSYQNYIGDIPPGFHICHKCDTPSCINPWLIFAFDGGTGKHTNPLVSVIKLIWYTLVKSLLG